MGINTRYGCIGYITWLLRIDIAKELTMTGRIISGLEAEKIGLVTRCVDGPFDEAMKIAKEIIER